MDYIIRTAENQDIEEIWNIGNNVSEFKTAPNVVTFWPKETLENCINKEDVMFYVVESKNKIIGFTIVNLNKSLGKAEIENIYILPKYRKNGIGKQLLEEILKSLKERSYNNVNCLADEAIGFYKYNGFTKGKNFAWMYMVVSKDFKKKDIE